MKAPIKHKIVREEEKDEYVALIHANLSSTFQNLRYLGRTTSVNSVYGVLLRELAVFTASTLLDAGQEPEEAEETLLKALEDVVNEEEEEEEEEEAAGGNLRCDAQPRKIKTPVITNPVPEKEVNLKGGLPLPGMDSRDGTAGGEDISDG